MPELQPSRVVPAQRVEERPALLAARFDRYLEAVAIHCGYRVEPTLAHLEVGFERMTEGLLRSGALDEKSFAAMGASLDRAAGSASTIGEVFTAYRQAVADVSEAIQRPGAARQDRSLRSAVDYIHQNYATPLRLGQVARVAGFAAGHFSKLFRRREGMAFEDYVAKLRLERAGQLLADTDLAVTRVAELAGFGSAPYFCRVFRRARGVTPLEYRRAPGGRKRQ